MTYITPETSTILEADLEYAKETSIDTLRKTVDGVTPELAILGFEDAENIPEKWDALDRLSQAEAVALMQTADWQPEIP